MTARDLAATVRAQLEHGKELAYVWDSSDFDSVPWDEALDRLAALVQQAVDAQVARAVAEDAKTLWDDANQRAVRYEEALRQIADAARRYIKTGSMTAEMDLSDALAAAGADTLRTFRPTAGISKGGAEREIARRLEAAGADTP